ncbi:MAG: FlgD immunoglobulin-like domain containing protein, partial [Candidatus Neomarinimicrobiota bacterium]
STSTPGEVRFYAYPNPFYLAEDNLRDGAGHVRFQYHKTTAEARETARVSIYDFAMDPVVSLTETRPPAAGAGDFSMVWDGRNEAGYQVANGVYYCRLRLGQAEYWTKVVVIK